MLSKMKLLVAFALALVACSSEEIPSIPGDNSHYVEGKSRYIWMPDQNGKPVLQDLHIKLNATVTSAKHGQNNQYWLYTRRNPNNFQLLVHNNANSIWQSNYNRNLPTKVIVHGWNNNGHSPLNPLITSAFLAVQDCNVIVVDWRSLAGNPLYPVSAAGVVSVGQGLGNFLLWLFNTAGGNWNQLHLVGHSLGAHVVGNAGRTAHGWPARVTGMDPAGPTWGGNPNALNRASGQYVEAIHTDGGILGIFDQIADADFYPNGGRHPQPGCWVIDSPCSHGRATEFFASSVRTNHFVGRLCPNIHEAQLSTCYGAAFNMGNAIITKRGSGIYALRTGSSWPY